MQHIVARSWRTPGVRGFAVLPKRWLWDTHSVGFRATAGAVKDYERKVQTSETLIQVAMIRLLIARLERKNEPVPKHPIRA